MTNQLNSEQLAYEYMLARFRDLGDAELVRKLDATVIVVEHYAYDNQLLHVVEGTACEDLYRTIIDARWVSQLSHAV